MNSSNAFREEVRGWLKTTAQHPCAHRWWPTNTRVVAAEPNTRMPTPNFGWTAAPSAATPCQAGRKEYGGAGLDKDEVVVLQQEMQRINARPALVGMGLSMIGPALLEYGTEAQKQEHLPKIARGDIWWCQGYSEPGSGSDPGKLTHLRSRRRRRLHR